MWKAMCPVWWLHIVDTRELVNEQELTHEELLSNTVDLELCKTPHNVQSGRENVNSYCGVLTFECIADAVVLLKRILRRRAHGHLFRFILQFDKWYTILSGTGNEGESDSPDGEGSAVKDVDGKKEAVF